MRCAGASTDWCDTHQPEFWSQSRLARSFCFCCFAVQGGCSTLLFDDYVKKYSVSSSVHPIVTTPYLASAGVSVAYLRGSSEWSLFPSPVFIAVIKFCTVPGVTETQLVFQTWQNFMIPKLQSSQTASRLVAFRVCSDHHQELHTRGREYKGGLLTAQHAALCVSAVRLCC